MADKAKLAIVGASARAAAQSAVRAGFDVVTADLFADEDLRQLCPATRIPREDYPEGLADWLAGQDVDAWMYTGALENFPDLVDRMSEIRPLWGNRGDALRRARDPFELWRLCQEAGVSFPDTAPEPKGLPHDGSWLCKTDCGSNGSGVWSLNGKPSLERAIDSAAVFQQRVFGKSYAAVYAVSGKACRLLHVTQQLVGEWYFGAGPWVYCGSLALSQTLSDDVVASLDKIGDVLRQGIGLRGVVGVDCVIDDKRVWLIEINPRYTASMELIDSAIACHAECFGPTAISGDAVIQPWLSGKAVLYAKRSACVTAEFTHMATQEAATGRLADIPAAETRIEKGQPVLTILEDGSPEGVLERLKTRAAEVESRLYA